MQCGCGKGSIVEWLNAASPKKNNEKNQQPTTMSWKEFIALTLTQV